LDLTTKTARLVRSHRKTPRTGRKPLENTKVGWILQQNTLTGRISTTTKTIMFLVINQQWRQLERELIPLSNKLDGRLAKPTKRGVKHNLTGKEMLEIGQNATELVKKSTKPNKNILNWL
jgi:hypothetical protein